MSEAAALLECGRKTLYRYVHDYYPELREFLDNEVRATIGDFAENMVMSHMKAGSLPAAQFYLRAQCKDRGWSDRVSIEHAGRVDVAVEVAKPAFDSASCASDDGRGTEGMAA
jgi:hypothetical protein